MLARFSLTTFTTLMLLLLPVYACAERDTRQEMQFGFAYGDAELKNLYDEDWNGKSLDIALGMFEKHYGLGLNYQFVDADVNEPALSGSYSSNGMEILFFLAERNRWLQVYGGLGAGLHYNRIDVSGSKRFEKEGFGGRLVGKAGLKLPLAGWEIDGKRADLALGGYAKYFASKDYFGSSEDDHFTALLFGAELGIRLSY